MMFELSLESFSHKFPQSCVVGKGIQAEGRESKPKERRDEALFSNCLSAENCVASS